MNKTKIILVISMLMIFLFNFAFAERMEETPSRIKQINQEKASIVSAPAEPLSEAKSTTKGNLLLEETSLPVKSSTTANFILIADVLDGFGGQKYDGGCNLSYFAGGQPSAIGAGTSTNYKLSAGFVYPTVVLCGDANGNGVVDAGDVVYLINYLYRNGTAPNPYQAGETNCNDIIDAGDIIKLVSYLYRGGAPPVC